MQFIVLSKIPPSPCPFSHLPASFLISSRPLVSLSIYPICQETHGVSFTMKLSRGDNNLFPKALVVLILRCHWLLLHQRALVLIFLVCITVTLYLAVFLVPCPKMCFQPKYNFSWFDHEISFLNTSLRSLYFSEHWLHFCTFALKAPSPFSLSQLLWYLIRGLKMVFVVLGQGQRAACRPGGLAEHEEFDKAGRC